MNEIHLPSAIVSIRYSQGQEYAYDSPRRGKARGGDWTVQAARGIIADLCDRRDIKRGFENVEADVRKEIVERLSAIIRFSHDKKPSEATSTDPKDEIRQLRFKLDGANRRIRELTGIEASTRDELKAAFQEECQARGTTPEHIISTKRIGRHRPLRYACVKAVCDRFPNVSVSDLARFFGVDRHFIYDVRRSEAE